MTIFTRFAPGGLSAEVTAGAAGASALADATARGYPASISNIGFAKIREFENTFTPAAIATGPGARPGTTIVAADTIKMFTIPANHVILSARLEVITAGTGAGTLVMSDGGALGAAAAVATVGQQTYTTTKVYTVDTSFNLVSAVANITDGLYRVVVLAVDMTGQDSTGLITG